jgi:predicted Zn finger-like uncharacterized protein
MLTQCPSCSTVFRVTAAILKMGHGQVRCGKCRTQFNALESLQEDDLDAAADQAESNAGTSSSERPSQSSEFFAGSKSIDQSDSPASENIEITDTSSGDAESNITESTQVEFDDAVEIELSSEGELATTDEDSVANIESHRYTDDEDNAEQREIPEYVIDEESIRNTSLDALLADTGAHDAFRSTSSHNTSSDSPPAKRRSWLRRGDRKDQQIADELAALTGGKPQASSNTRAWTVASIALLFISLVQVVNHYRDEWVRNPQVGSIITRTYHVLGLTLTPRWELTAYELQQWGIVSDPKAPDTLRVRASVTNRAQFAQPYPLIRLELQDQWGAPVAVRIFNSEEYLPEKSNALRLLAPKQRANAEIAIADPGADAVGFQIRACMQYEQGISCSDE